LLFLGAYLSIQVSPFAARLGVGLVGWCGSACRNDDNSDLSRATIFISFLVVHVVVAIGLGIRSLVKDKKFGLNKIPGLPLLLMAVFLFQIMQVVF